MPRGRTLGERHLCRLRGPPQHLPVYAEASAARHRRKRRTYSLLDSFPGITVYSPGRKFPARSPGFKPGARPRAQLVRIASSGTRAGGLPYWCTLEKRFCSFTAPLRPESSRTILKCVLAGHAGLARAALSVSRAAPRAPAAGHGCQLFVAKIVHDYIN